MKIQMGFFAARRYWSDEAELTEAYEALREKSKDLSPQSALITDENDLKHCLNGGECLITVPMSGAVQPLILAAAQKYQTGIIYPAYVRGNAAPELENTMLRNNAAPTTMDCWSVLRRTHEHMLIALNRAELNTCVRVMEAYMAMQGANLLLIGDTEPWVISSGDRAGYSRFGVNIRQVSQAEVAEVYRSLSPKDAEKYCAYFKSDAKAIIEPTDTDIIDAGRMAAALESIIEKYNADGIALACFNLLSEGTTACLGVSYINDCTRYIAACEGDLDSAVTMLAMHRITKSKLWMANPGLHPDKTVNFSHCTAPLNLIGQGKCPYTLRNHHESGIGASLQVDYPVGQTVTACRISERTGEITIQNGQIVPGTYECACRTQVHVRFDDFDHYLNTALGCHQVFAFEDIAGPMQILAKQLKLKTI